MSLLKNLFLFVIKIIAFLPKKLYKSIFKATPRGKIRWAVFAILILAVLVGNLDYPKYWDSSAEAINKKWESVPGPTWLKSIKAPHFYDIPFRLGLDLQGGTHLVYEANVSNLEDQDKGDAVEGVRDVIERRVNAYGVAEPVVQTTKVGDSWRVIVELAGVRDVKEAIKMIGETPLLEFKEQTNPEDAELTPEQQKELDDFNNSQKEKAEEALGKIKQGQDFTEIVNEYSGGLEAKEGGIIENVRKEGSIYSELFEKAEETGLNKVSGIIETTEGYNIIKPQEKSDQAKEVNANHILICWKGLDRCESEYSKEEAFEKIKKLKEDAAVDNFTELAKENSTEPGVSETGGALGWFSSGMMVKEFEDAVMAQEVGTISDIVETQFGYHIIYKEDERDIEEYKLARVLLQKKRPQDIVPFEPWTNTELSGKQLVRSQVEFDPNTNEPQVGLTFNDEGKKLFAELTEKNVGKPIAIFLDEMPISAPTVNEPIREGKAVISGSFNIKEAKLLAQRLNAGALPVPINLMSQQTVGASLGAESVQKSLFAGLIGLILVAGFMILVYRIPGFVAVLALAVYGLLMLALFKVIGVTLTLSGIAGFILSIGMAVDANVLIFERIKEELRIGKTLITAIDEGFSRAWPSIRDGNASTLITCLILATFSTSMVKGFAVTLGIGVLVSMFSAIVITRVFLKLFARWGIRNIKWLWGRN